MTSNETGDVRVQLDLTLASAGLLWDSAALEASTVHGMKSDAIVETLGPREDPDVSACASLLFDTVARRSGAFDAIEITVTTPDEQQAASEDLSQPCRKPRGGISLAI